MSENANKYTSDIAKEVFTDDLEMFDAVAWWFSNNFQVFLYYLSQNEPERNQ